MNKTDINRYLKNHAKTRQLRMSKKDTQILQLQCRSRNLLMLALAEAFLLFCFGVGQFFFGG
ncbi:MAG: hypothetical protein WC959_05600 [Kiritimatiellales bacterium]